MNQPKLKLPQNPKSTKTIKKKKISKYNTTVKLIEPSTLPKNNQNTTSNTTKTSVAMSHHLKTHIVMQKQRNKKRNCEKRKLSTHKIYDIGAAKQCDHQGWQRQKHRRATVARFEHKSEQWQAMAAPLVIMMPANDQRFPSQRERERERGSFVRMRQGLNVCNRNLEIILALFG